MIVADASVLVPALSDDGPSGDRARARLLLEDFVAPELIDLEVTSALRGRVMSGKLPERRAEMALVNLSEMPFERVPHRRLIARCWELRVSLTVYDAAYVSLAELTESMLVTADARLARAPGLLCSVDVLTD